MMLCGQEEPVRANDCIYQLDEVLEKGVLSDVVDARLNRYSFVWLGKLPGANLEFAHLINAILTESPTLGTWVAAYETGGDARIRTELIEAWS